MLQLVAPLLCACLYPAHVAGATVQSSILSCGESCIFSRFLMTRICCLSMLQTFPGLMQALCVTQIADAILQRWMPMLIPPRPWVAPNIGGHISNPALIMRMRGSKRQMQQLFRQHHAGKLSQVSRPTLAVNTQGFWFVGSLCLCNACNVRGWGLNCWVGFPRAICSHPC